MLLRATGRVLRTSVREGVNATTGKPWRMCAVHVLVENQGVAEVNVSDVLHAQVREGQDIDWLVEVEGGRFLNVRFVSDLAPVHLVDAKSPKVAG